MHIEIPHNFGGREAALSRVKRALDEARPKTPKEATISEERWEDNVLHFDVTAQGQRITGTLTVEDTQFVLDAKLPLMLRMFEGQIKRAIEEQTKKALEQ